MALWVSIDRNSYGNSVLPKVVCLGLVSFRKTNKTVGGKYGIWLQHCLHSQPPHPAHTNTHSKSFFLSQIFQFPGEERLPITMCVLVNTILSVEGQLSVSFCLLSHYTALEI